MNSNTPEGSASTRTFDAVSAAARRAIRPRPKIGPYLIERELGRGAHGRVFAARHPETRDRLVALKLVENRGSLDSLLLEPEILYCSPVPPSRRMSQPMDDDLEQIILQLRRQQSARFLQAAASKLEEGPRSMLESAFFMGCSCIT